MQRGYLDEASRTEAGARTKSFVPALVASRVGAEPRCQQRNV